MSGICEIYRESSIGRCLQDALVDLIADGKITPLLGMQVVMQFDKVRPLGCLVCILFYCDK